MQIGEESMSNQSSENTRKQPRIFPKLFIADASKAFVKYLHTHNYDYPINYISSREDLIELIDKYSAYSDYNVPVIISDISFLNNKDQSLLLKFMEDSHLNIILLASRDNILGTIISRVKEFRKYYVKEGASHVGFISVGKAREMFTNDVGNFDDDLSIEDKLCVYNKYNPMLSYDDKLVKRYSQNDKRKLLNILEYSNEQ